jgi:hypothetical protein
MASALSSPCIAESGGQLGRRTSRRSARVVAASVSTMRNVNGSSVRCVTRAFPGDQQMNDVE